MQKDAQDAPATKKDFNLLEAKIDTLRKETTEDLETWGGNLIVQMQEAQEENNKRFDKQDRVLEALLVITQTLSGQLAPLKETPEKLENHEERITTLEVRSRIG